MFQVPILLGNSSPVSWLFTTRLDSFDGDGGSRAGRSKTRLLVASGIQLSIVSVLCTFRIRMFGLQNLTWGDGALVLDQSSTSTC